jgi:hypothetical protein
LAGGCCAVDSKCEVRSLLHRLRDNDSIQTIRELIAVSPAGERPFRKCFVDFELLYSFEAANMIVRSVPLVVRAQ